MNVSKVMPTVAKCFLGVILVTSALVADDTETKEVLNIEVGSRAMSQVERVELQEARAKRAEENQDQKAGGGECEGDNCPVPVEGRMHKAINAGVDAKTYYTSHEGAYHNPYAVSLFGDTVELEDGSIWAVSLSDRHKTLDWMTSDVILVTQNTSWFSVYNYVLVNLNTGVHVNVNLSLGPIYNGLYTHFVTAVDYLHSEIYLEDGSIWKVSNWDTSISSQWLPNDTIIIGVNDDWLTQGLSPNILINVNTNNYAAANCIY